MNTTITDHLANHVADTQVLWNKVHNLHWKVQGQQFRPVHELTESIYEELGEQFDALAERMLILGTKPPSGLAECLKLSKVKETAAASFSASEVIEILRADLGTLASEYRKTRRLASDNDDPGTDSLLTGFIEGLEKQLWMLSASL